jgi:hypothetical protein
MERYSGKSKCSCGKRAKYRAVISGGCGQFACEDHKNRLDKFEDDKESEHLTEADYQTWKRI